MNRLTKPFLFFLFIGLTGLTAYCAFPQDGEPPEPEIVLPPVILEVEDLSTEEVVASLPDYGEVLPPEEDFPLPEPAELEVSDPITDFPFPKMDFSVLPKNREGSLAAEGVLGVGTKNHFYSSISLFKLGEKPEGKVQFQHEVLDGFASNPPGSGYNMREDNLEGSLRFDVGKVQVRTDAAFVDIERGLQGNGSFYSKINRFLRAELSSEYQPEEWFSLCSELKMSQTSQLLTQADSSGTDSEKVLEYLISPSFKGTFEVGRFSFGLLPRLSYRSVPKASDLNLTRGEVEGFFGFDLSPVSRFEASMSWFWSESTGHLIPFELALLLSPREKLDLRTSVGYRVQEYNLESLLSDFPLVDVPATLKDSHGWFLDLRTTFHLFKKWIVNSGITFMDNSDMPNPGQDIDATTGLFPFDQEESLRMEYDIGARWNISKRVSARFGWETELLDRPRFFPKNRWTIEAIASQRSGKYGGSLAAALLTGVNDDVEAPVVDIGGYIRITEFFRLVMEIDDLFSPLLNSPRYTWEPYVDTELNATLKAHINF